MLASLEGIGSGDAHVVVVASPNDVLAPQALMVETIAAGDIEAAASHTTTLRADKRRMTSL
jgi:hypothetical protein